MAAIYRWNGEYFGFTSGNNLFDAKGNYIASVDGESVWKADGSYLGKVVEGAYVLRSTTFDVQSRGGRPAAPGTTPIPSPGKREPRGSLSGYIDALEEFH